MTDKNNNKGYANFSAFYIDSSTTDYTLHVSGYSGIAKDSLKYHNLMKVNDNVAGNWGSSDNCAIEFTSAWWYNNCYYSNFNGPSGIDTVDGIVWPAYSLPYV